jgi:D-glycero-alpha-D-manno-heptose-7-phosphate kinase
VTAPDGATVATSVEVHVPVRACDVGGWTDTWFAHRGRVCSLAVGPGVSAWAAATPGGGAISIDATDFGVTFTVGSEPPEHRLLAEAVREAGTIGSLDVRLRLASAVPPSTSLGTSAAVCVGIIAALDALRGDIRPPAALAAAAHRAEAERFGRQSGVQDQLAAAFGGANLVDIVRYPDVEVRPVPVPPAFWATIDRRLAHIAYGSPHDSSAVHEEVIAVLADEGPSSPRLERIRHLAGEAEQALIAADLDRYGRVLTAATDAQAALHPALISDAAHELINLARACDAAGWKVNGAGGGGGSISILCRRPSDRDTVIDEATRLGHIPLALSLSHHGARAVEP